MTYNVFGGTLSLTQSINQPPNNPTGGEARGKASRCRRVPVRVIFLVKGRIGWRRGRIRL